MVDDILDFENRRAELRSNEKTVFISYSHDSEQHKIWVKKLAYDVRQYGFDVVLDQDEIEKIDFQNRSDADRNVLFGEIQAMFDCCKNVLFINTPLFCEKNDTEKLESGKPIPTHWGQLETQVILYNAPKGNFRIISILRDGKNYISGTDGVKFPMIMFRYDSQYSKSLHILIEYMLEPLPDKNFVEIFEEPKEVVKCDCGYSSPLFIPPVKICKNCGSRYNQNRILCPKCGYHDFNPDFQFLKMIEGFCPRCKEKKLKRFRIS